MDNLQYCQRSDRKEKNQLSEPSRIDDSSNALTALRETDTVELLSLLA